jgi:hypothetical protein
MGQVLRAALAVGVICAWGGVFTLLLPTSLRRTFALAAPSTGAALFIALSHWLNPVMTSRTSGLILSIGGLVALATLGVIRRRDLGFGLRDVGLMALLCAAALPGIALVTSHLRHSETPGLVFASPNHDAFYFSAVDDWLLNNRSTAVPDIGNSSASANGPADGPAASYQPFKRWGEGALQTIPSAVSGGRTSEHWQLLTACWLLLWPGAVYLLMSGWGSRRRSSAVVGGVAGGALASVFGIVSYAILNQNGPLILGMGLMVAAIGTLGIYLRTTGSGLMFAALACIPFVGWLGTYFELAVIGAPLIVALVLLQKNLRTPAPWKALLTFGICTAIIGLVPVFNAMNGFLVVGGAKPTWPSYFSNGTLQANVAKLLGVRPIDSLPAAPDDYEALRIGLVAMLSLISCGIAMTWREARISILMMIIPVASYWYLLSRGDTNYTSNRVVLMLAVTVAMLSVAAAAVRTDEWLRCRDSHPAYLALVPVVAYALLYGAAVANSLHVVRTSVDFSVPGRATTRDDAAAIGWINALGGPSGSNIQIATARYAKQLILLDLTRDKEDTSWASLFRDYATVTSFDDPGAPVYVLTDRNALVIGRADKTRQNSTWALYELHGPSAIVTQPKSMEQSPGPGHSVTWTGLPGDSAVAMSAQCSAFTLQLSSADGSDRELAASVSDDADQTTATPITIGADPTPLEVVRVGDGGMTLRLTSSEGTPAALVVDAPSSCTTSPGE